MERDELIREKFLQYAVQLYFEGYSAEEAIEWARVEIYGESEG